jgi:hypothetical protein
MTQFRLPTEVREEIAGIAKRDGITMTEVIVRTFSHPEREDPDLRSDDQKKFEAEQVSLARARRIKRPEGQIMNASIRSGGPIPKVR